MNDDFFEVDIHGNQDSVFTEMAQIIVPSKEMLLTLGIFINEGSIAHFHFYKRRGVPSKGTGGGCLMFLENKYFNHDTHTEVLKPKELKTLVEFLKSPYEDIPSITVWKYLVTLWNSNNPTYRIDPNTPIPAEEYKDIKLYKE